MIHVISSDDDASFQSVGSSTTEMFQPTDQAYTDGLSPTGLRTEEPLVERSCDTDSVTVNIELPSVSATVNTWTVPDCSQTGTEPGHQLSPSSLTKDPLIVEAKGGELSPGHSTEELLEENCLSSAIKADDSENALNSSDKNVFTENSTSEAEHISTAPTLAVSECDIKTLQNCEASEYKSKDTNMSHEELTHSGNTAVLLTPQLVAFSDGLDDISTRTFSAQLNSNVTSEPHCEEGLLTHSPDCVDDASKDLDSPIQDVDCAADEEGDDTALESTSTIPRRPESAVVMLIPGLWCESVACSECQMLECHRAYTHAGARGRQQRAL
ncbi:hypothetical protein WMY93_013755 [Mugilogobius chulae]|uniref:Uncharacterized protein n=1 Tax=Mugilogobius chulae TaxID=88201 RepID=A0AAW0P6Y3_9GOBI